MSTKKEEEEVKLLTETCKSLFTLFLTLSGGLAFMLRTYLNKNGSSGFDGILLVFGSVIDAGLFAVILRIWFIIKGVIKTL